MAEMTYPLALVTGAARRLGRAFAVSLARQGYALLLHFNQSREQAIQAGNEIHALGVPIFLFQADLCDLAEIDEMFTYLDTIPHKLSLLVNSAAAMPRQDIRTLAAEDWDATLALNLRAPFLLAQRAARRMAAGGLIVNVTDAGAGKAWTGYPAYSVSKAALENLTRLLAKALAPDIRVNAIAPGLVVPNASLSEAEWDKLLARLPLKRPASLDEVTSALEYLLKNRAVTGQVLAVDGGYTLI